MGKGVDGVEKNCLGGKKLKMNKRGHVIRHSRAGTKFRLKMTLEFLDQINTKGYFRTKKHENYHRILHIQINLDCKF